MEAGGDRYGAVLIDDQELLSARTNTETLELTIIDDDHLEHGGVSVHMSPAVLALNGLIKCRGEGYVTAEVLRDSVGYDAPHSLFNDDMKRIKAALELLTGRDDLVQTPGVSKGKRYFLADEIDLADRRHDAMYDPALRQRYFDFSGELPAFDEYDGEWLEFRTNDARRRAFSAMLSEVSDRPIIRWFSQRLAEGGWPHRLSSDILEDNFRTIEKALAAFMQPDYVNGRYDDELFDGALAFREVFLSTLHRADELSRQMTRLQHGRLADDLFQDAAEKLMEYVMTFRPSDLNRGTLEAFFYSRMAKVTSGTMLHRLEEERWGCVGVSEKKRRLIRSINRTSETLQQEFGREPSGPEIAERLKVSEEEVEEALYMMGRANYSIDTEYFRDETGRRRDIEVAMARMSMRTDQIDDAIDFLDKRRQVDALFDSDRIKTRDKIALSVFYGVFVPGLCGKSFEKLTRVREVPFVYPDTQEEFDSIVARVENSYTHTSRLLGFNKGKFAGLIEESLVASRIVMRSVLRGE